MAVAQAELISPSQLSRLLTIGWMALAMVLSYFVLAPFLSVFIWAITLAVLFRPLQSWLDARCKYHTFNALLTSLFIGCVLVFPIAWGMQQLAIQLYIGADSLQVWLQTASWQQAANTVLIRRYAHYLQLYLDLPQVLNGLNGWLLGMSANWVRNSALGVVQMGLVFYVLFFLLRDHLWVRNSLNMLTPLAPHQLDGLLQELTATIQAIVYGTLVIAVIQGFLGGLMFWWLALPTPLLWGGLMALVSIVPMLGPFMVWVPAVIYLSLMGHWQDAMLLAAWGLLVVGTIDNWLRPYWVGRQLHLHPLQIFFSIVGGLLLFGSAGLILGPVIIATTRFLMVCWKTPNT